MTSGCCRSQLAGASWGTREISELLHLEGDSSSGHGFHGCILFLRGPHILGENGIIDRRARLVGSAWEACETDRCAPHGVLCDRCRRICPDRTQFNTPLFHSPPEGSTNRLAIPDFARSCGIDSVRFPRYRRLTREGSLAEEQEDSWAKDKYPFEYILTASAKRIEKKEDGKRGFGQRWRLFCGIQCCHAVFRITAVLLRGM